MCLVISIHGTHFTDNPLYTYVSSSAVSLDSPYEVQYNDHTANDNDSRLRLLNKTVQSTDYKNISE